MKTASNYIWVIQFLACTSLAFAAGCASVDPEEASYPAAWPVPEMQSGTACSLPAGTFANLSNEAIYEYEHSSYRIAPTLFSLLITESPADTISYFQIGATDSGKQRIRLYSITDTMAQLVDEQWLDSSTFRCDKDRLVIISDTVYPGISSYSSTDYNPLVTAAYAIGTLGVGAPISRKWEYRFTLRSDGSLAVRRTGIESGLLFLIYTQTASDDDWFVFPAIDESGLLKVQPAAPESVE